jgi:hypothetical protein
MIRARAGAGAPRNKVEAAHSAAALALRRMADAGDMGVWEGLTRHLIWTLPRHYLYSRQWQQLCAMLCNLCFMTRMVAVRGVEEAIDTYTAALDGIADSGEAGDVAAEAYRRLEMHRSFLRGLGRRGGQVTGAHICRAAVDAKLDCVADLAHTIHTTIQTARRLLASAAALEPVQKQAQILSLKHFLCSNLCLLYGK